MACNFVPDCILISHIPAVLAYPDDCLVRVISLFQKQCCSMSYQSLLLHFSKSQASASCSSFNWLSCKQSNFSGCASVHFVLYHVFQLQVVHVSDVDFCIHSLSGYSVVHCFFSIISESHLS